MLRASPLDSILLNEVRSDRVREELLKWVPALRRQLNRHQRRHLPRRQAPVIIIDTERLLADRNRLTVSEFRARSENIGLDQHLLRLRYGEIVGDEVVEGETDPQVAHEHDVEENATRLAPQVKATLQAALAQMWDAELRLRMSDPQAALPYEYRALELLKERSA